MLIAQHMLNSKRYKAHEKCFLFGGIRSTPRHYRHALEVYRSYDFEVEFVLSRYYGVSTFVPALYRRQVGQLELYGANKSVIHTSSGGFWAGIELNHRIKSDRLIIENGPILATPEQFLDSTQKIYSITYPQFMHALLPKLMNVIGIPTPQHMPEFFASMSTNVKAIHTALILNGNRDVVVNHDYVASFVEDLRKQNTNVRAINFSEGTHTQVYKGNIIAYQEAIEREIRCL
jgi:hypothetical protein